MADIFLGEPPSIIKQWIIDHAQPGPAGHPETRFTLQDGTVETKDITGTLDQQWMIDNGYYDVNEDSWLKTITQVDIGNTVTSIGAAAFQYCELTSVTIPNSVTNIEEDAFAGSNLTNVTLGDNVTSIGAQAFAYCSGLTSVSIPDSVTNIGENAFEDCSSLTSMTIGSGVTSIEGEAFSRCEGLTNITIPDSVTSIGDMAFSSCINLTSVTITANGGNAENVKQAMIAAGVDENITWNMS